MILKYISYKKVFFNSVNISFDNDFCFIQGHLSNEKFKLRKGVFFFLKSSYILIHPKYLKSFFSLLFLHLEGVSKGFKTTLYVKGKGLRLQLKKRKGQLFIYLKLGYSHKIFLHLPQNCWAKIFGRRRTIRLYALNYILLRNLVLKIKRFYPVGLYKIRGFYIETEEFKIVEGKSRLGGGFGYYG